MLDWITWYLLLTLLGVLALPAAYRLLPQLADRGYIFARSLGLLVWGFIFWLLTSFGLLQNNTGGVLAALVGLAALGLWFGRGWAGFHEIFGFLRSRWRMVLVTELLFLAAFGFAALMRATDPIIGGTEKPMELAFINAILRSPQFPPNDPWLSGYSISYYYFGYVMVSMLIRLSAVGVGVGFNLAIASMFALAALGAYGIAYSLLAAWSRRRQAEGKSGLFSQGWALLAPFFVLILSNVEGVLEMLHARGIFWTQAGDTWVSPFWTWLDLPELVNAPSLPFSWMPTRLGGIWWWRASRVIQDYSISGTWKEVIDEFPFFSYYLADLHPHVLAMPFVLLAAGLGLNLFLSGARQDFSSLSLGGWLKRLDFWLAALVLGGLAFLNTWDFPIYVALFSAAFTLARFQQDGWSWRRRLGDFIGLGLALGIAGIALYLPFYFGFASQAGGILPSMAFYSRGVQFWIMFATLLVPIFCLLIWLASREGRRKNLLDGLKLAVGLVAALWIFSFLIGLVGINLPAIGQALGGDTGSTILGRLGQSFIQWGNMFADLQGTQSGAALLGGSFSLRIESPGTWLTLLILITLVWGLLANFAPRRKEAEQVELELAAEAEPEAEAVPVGVTAFEPDGMPNRLENVEDFPQEAGPMQAEAETAPIPMRVPVTATSPLPFLLLMILVGGMLALAPEFVYLRDQFGTRMNTIFKFYFQTWILWGVAAAVASTILLVELKRAWKAAFSLVWVLVLACGLAYPVFALSQRLSSDQLRNLNLDGTAYFYTSNPADMAAIDYLKQAPLGTVAEAVGGSYTTYARVSMLSGQPAVLGWVGHELQWRGGTKEIGSREGDISTLYSTSDWTTAQTFLQKYEIRYVFVGSLERAKYKVSEGKFKAHLAAVYTSGNTVVYEVPDSVLASGQ